MFLFLSSQMFMPNTVCGFSIVQKHKKSKISVYGTAPQSQLTYDCISIQYGPETIILYSTAQGFSTQAPVLWGTLMKPSCSQAPSLQQQGELGVHCVMCPRGKAGLPISTSPAACLSSILPGTLTPTHAVRWSWADSKSFGVLSWYLSVETKL